MSDMTAEERMLNALGDWTELLGAVESYLKERPCWKHVYDTAESDLPVIAGRLMQAAAARARAEEREAWEQVAGMVERLAFDMRAPNVYTPQFVQLMIEARQAAAIRARSRSGSQG